MKKLLMEVTNELVSEMNQRERANAGDAVARSKLKS